MVLEDMVHVQFSIFLKAFVLPVSSIPLVDQGLFFVIWKLVVVDCPGDLMLLSDALEDFRKLCARRNNLVVALDDLEFFLLSISLVFIR